MHETAGGPVPRERAPAEADELSLDALDGVAGGLERVWIGEGVPIVSTPGVTPAPA